MSEYKQIPGVETRFNDHEIRILIEHFRCKTVDDLRRAAQRYESLFFMFTPEEDGVDGSVIALLSLPEKSRGWIVK